MDDEQGLVVSREVWSGWATLAWGLLIAAIFMATQLFVIGAYVAVNYGYVAENKIAALVEFKRLAPN